MMMMMSLAATGGGMLIKASTHLSLGQSQARLQGNEQSLLAHCWRSGPSVCTCLNV
jgi:hypothetical protein